MRVTGAGDTVSKSSHVPVTPKQIANRRSRPPRRVPRSSTVTSRSRHRRARARALDLYREVTTASAPPTIDVVLNLTAAWAETSSS